MLFNKDEYVSNDKIEKTIITFAKAMMFYITLILIMLGFIIYGICRILFFLEGNAWNYIFHGLVALGITLVLFVRELIKDLAD